MTLKELTEEYQTVYEMASDPDMDPDTWYDTLEGLGGDIEVKADNYGWLVKQLDADASTLKAEEERLANKRRTIENSIKSLKANLQYAMETTGKTKFKTPFFSFGIQNNPASVIMDEQYLENIPQEYLKYKDPEIDKKKIAEDLKAGKDLNGLAHLEQTKSLRIR